MLSGSLALLHWYKEQYQQVEYHGILHKDQKFPQVVS